MNNYMFMTITGETCAGKSHLLDELVARDIVNKIVSCTTRPPRVGEVEGKDYYFLSKDDFQWALDRGDFAEVVEFNGTYYGTTHGEIQTKVDGKKPGVIIVEPKGVEIYRKYCSSQRIQMIKIYVMTPEKVRLDRLSKRFMKELELSSEERLKLIERFTKRIYATATEEQQWSLAHKYDLYVSGEYTESAISLIKEAIRNF